MATVSGLTAAQMLLLADDNINGGIVNDLGNLVLTTRGGKSIDAGPIMSSGTVGQYYRGDKTWQNLNKAAVGLDQVENVASSTVYLPRWKPNTAYALGQQVVLPTNDVGTPVAAFTSGATFDFTKWIYSSSAARGLLWKNVVSTSSGVTSNAIINNLTSFTFKAGRKYRIVWDAAFNVSVANDCFSWEIDFAPVGDAAGSLSNLSVIGSRTKYTSFITASPLNNGPVVAYYEPTADITTQVKFRILRTVGTGNLAVVASANEKAVYAIYDDGAQF